MDDMEIEEIDQIKQKNDDTIVFKQKNKENLPWIEKYRPANLKDLISHQSIIETINKFIEENKLPNLLFYGPPGTGKTSTIVACAKQMYGNAYASSVLELNASDERGIDVVRQKIKDFCSSQTIMTMSNKHVKLVILDEADSMTSAAQFALRRIMEKYAKNARFCIICNYVSKVIPALQSRCTRFKFKHIPQEDAKKRVLDICNQEKLTITNDAIDAIFKLCEGDMRKVVNMLQSISISLSSNISKTFNAQVDKIDATFIYNLTGNIHPDDIDHIFNTLLTQDLQTAFTIIQTIKIEKGISMNIILKELTIKLMEVELPSAMKIFLVQRMAELDLNESKQKVKKILDAIFQTLEYMKQNDEYFNETNNGISPNNPNTTLKGTDCFFEWNEEYNHDDNIPIKHRYELKQFMQIKYIKRIELFHSGIIDEFQEWDKIFKKIDSSHKKIYDELALKADSQFLKFYFDNEEDTINKDNNNNQNIDINSNMYLIKRSLKELDIIMKQIELMSNWRKTFENEFKVFDMDFEVEKFKEVMVLI